MGQSGRRRLTITLFVLFVIVGSALGVAGAAQGDTVMKGVSVAGISAGGLTRESLTSKLEPAAREAESRSIVLVAGDKTWNLRPTSLGINTDVDKTAAAALRTGRSGPIQWVRSWIRPQQRSVAWIARVDRTVFERRLTQLTEELQTGPTAGSVAILGTQVVVTRPAEGLSIDWSDAESILRRVALDKVTERIELPVVRKQPLVTEAQIARVEAEAKTVLQGPVQFVAGERTITIPPEAIASVLEARPVMVEEDSAELILQADPRRLEALIASVAPVIVNEPKDASFETQGDTARVVPSIDGTKIDGAATADAVNKLRLGGSRVPIVLPVIREPAEFTTAEATALGITTRVSTFTTPFDPTNSPRVTNIDLMAAGTDNKLVLPGEEFSLNRTTGPRNEQNGYKEAQIILNGELVPGIGGGVCQFGTTLFNAVFFAGLKVEERSNHSLYISNYPVGRDATVFFDTGKDLRFRNDTPYGLLVRATVNRKSLNISIYSSPLARKVDYTTSPRRNPKPAPTKYVDDPTLPAGQEVVQEPGSEGFDITVVRTVNEGEKTLHNDTFVSKYRPWKRIVRRGTGPPAPATNPAPSPATT